MSPLPQKYRDLYDLLYQPLCSWFQSTKQTQTEIYQIYKNESTFRYHDLSNMTNLIKMATKLSTNIGNADRQQALETSINYFFVKAVQGIMRLGSSHINEFLIFPRSYAAIGFATRDFYLALNSLIVLMKMTKSSYEYATVLRLCIHLKEWNLLNHFLKMDLECVDDLLSVKVVCKLYYEFYTCNNVTRQFAISDEVVKIRDKHTTARSYGSYWTSQLCYNLLAATIKLPDADVLKYRCPVANYYFEKSKSMSPLASRLTSFFNYNSLCILFDFEEVPEDDSLLKRCCAFSDYWEALYNYSEAQMDAGLIHDASYELLCLGFIGLRSAMLTRVLIPYSTLHYVKLRTEHDRDKLKGTGAILALLLTATKGDGAQELRNNLIDDHYVFRKPSDSDSIDYTPEFDECYNYQIVHHAPDCLCDMCVTKTYNYSCNIEVSFAHLVLQNFSVKAYNKFLTSLMDEACKIMGKRRGIGLSLLGTEVATTIGKMHRVFEIGRRYCFSTYATLHFNKLGPSSSEKLCNALIKWSQYFLEHRFYWLYGRQTLRTPCDLDAYPWLASLSVDDDDDLMGNNSLFQCFKGFTKRPKKPSRFELSPTRVSKTEQRIQETCNSFKVLNLNDNDADGPVYEDNITSQSSSSYASCPTTPSMTPKRRASPESNMSSIFDTPKTPISRTRSATPTRRTPSGNNATPKTSETKIATTPSSRLKRSQSTQSKVLNFDELMATTPPTTPSRSCKQPQSIRRTPGRSTVISDDTENKTPSVTDSEPVINFELEEMTSDQECQSNTEALEVNNARGDFKRFSHLLFSDWRPVICLYIGAYLAESFPWHSAYYFVESLATPLRTVARTHKKQPQELLFHNTADLKEFIRVLPSHVNIIQLIVDPRNVLWIVRLNSQNVPIILPVVKIDHASETISSRMVQIMKNNDESVTLRDPVEFWKVRDALDKNLLELLENIEKVWLGSFKTLLIPFTHTKESLTDKKVFNSISTVLKKAGLSQTRAHFLSELLLNAPDEDFQALLNIFIFLDRADVNPKYYEISAQKTLHTKLLTSVKKLKLPKTKVVEDKFTIIMLSPQLSVYPWEMLPLFENCPMVMRCQSMHFFERLLNGAGCVPKVLDSSKLYYVINPGNDLQKTEQRMRDALKLADFPGSVQVPPDTSISHILNQYELLFYVGHGSGNTIFGTRNIRNSICKAATILMGCSSARIEQQGRMFDGKGAVNDYVVAGSPFVMGCLWMVTDGEIDRYFVAFMRFCCAEFVNEESSFARKMNSHMSFDPLRILITAMVRARSVCRLKYLTGGSVVAYGIPCINSPKC